VTLGNAYRETVDADAVVLYHLPISIHGLPSNRENPGGITADLGLTAAFGATAISRTSQIPLPSLFAKTNRALLKAA